jgi:hypothetical protein
MAEAAVGITLDYRIYGNNNRENGSKGKTKMESGKASVSVHRPQVLENEGSDQEILGMSSACFAWDTK